MQLLFSLILVECDSYLLECQIDSVHGFLLEEEGREVEVLERLASFTLNGTHGRGTSELTIRFQD